MASMQKGDTGVVIQITVYEDDGTTPWDLSGATVTKQLILGPPSGSPKVFDAVFVTDGTDGKLKYLTTSEDIDIAGTWQVQAYWVDTGGAGDERRSTVTNFQVEENIE
jgi:hypothetical protein